MSLKELAEWLRDEANLTRGDCPADGGPCPACVRLRRRQLRTAEILEAVEELCRDRNDVTPEFWEAFDRLRALREGKE